MWVKPVIVKKELSISFCGIKPIKTERKKRDNIAAIAAGILLSHFFIWMLRKKCRIIKKKIKPNNMKRL